MMMVMMLFKARFPLKNSLDVDDIFGNEKFSDTPGNVKKGE